MNNKKKAVILSIVAVLLVAVITAVILFFTLGGEGSKKKIIIVQKGNSTSDIESSVESEPEESEPEDTSSEESEPEDTVSEESEPEDVTSEESEPEDTSSQEDESEDTYFEEEEPEDTSSEEEEPEDTSSEEPDLEEDTEDTVSRERRELYQKEEKERYVEVFKPEYTTESVSWDGPRGYTVIFPEGNEELKKSALRIKDYIYQEYGVELWVFSDATEQVAKEILVGKTNRTVENFAEEDGVFAVKLIDGKLLFEGTHYVSVNKAVDAFISLDAKSGYVNTLEGSFEFESTVKDGYEYAWGDEFDGSVLDSSKWDLDTSMTGTSTMKLDRDNCIKVEDGRLKLYALHFFDETDPNVEFAVPFSVTTRNTMSFQYGYLEMRARVPFEVGAWPSLWSGTNGSLGPHVEGLDYTVEVDIFEVFASENELVPNTHKWYKNDDHTQGGIQTDGQNKKSFVFENNETLSNEYHTYGFEWTPKTMTMYVDGVAYTTIDITKSYDENDDMRGFTDPLMLKINNHLFVADSGFKPYGGCTVDGAELPFEYFIDYIRLYQKPNAGNLYLGQ